MLDMLLLAADAAKSSKDKRRHALIGAVAIRADGAIVRSRNGSAQRKQPSCHAEARLCNKVDRGARVYVCRVLKNGQMALSKPCPRCMSVMRSHGVASVTYSIGPNEWGSVSLD